MRKSFRIFYVRITINKFKIDVDKYYKVASYIHVRFDKDNETDFIHIDQGLEIILNFIISLSY